MCFDDRIKLNKENEVVCCVTPELVKGKDTPWVTDDEYGFGNIEKSFCKPSIKNKCTYKYRADPILWHSFCPSATEKRCGGHRYLYAFNET
jgi:hypothetical protein